MTYAAPEVALANFPASSISLDRVSMSSRSAPWSRTSSSEPALVVLALRR